MKLSFLDDTKNDADESKKNEVSFLDSCWSTFAKHKRKNDVLTSNII